jgi:prepilin signal peptidase PulO-like enzyme (type II secretory pathway)
VDDTPLPSRNAVLLSAGLGSLLAAALTVFMPCSAAIATAFLAAVMGFITVIDLRYFITPDRLSVFAALAGLVAIAQVIHGGTWGNSMAESLTGAALGAGAFVPCARDTAHCVASRGLALAM